MGADDGSVFNEKMEEIRRQMPAEAKVGLAPCDEVALGRALWNLRPRYDEEGFVHKTRYLDAEEQAEASPEKVALLSLRC